MKKILTISLLVLLFACNKSEPDPVQTPYFEVTFANDFLPGGQYWVIVHNKEGEILGTQKFREGSHLVFDTVGSVGDEIGVTLFLAAPADNPTQYMAESFLGVPAGSEWRIPREPFPINSGSWVGPINVTVSGTSLGNANYTYMSNRYSGNVGESSGASQVSFQNCISSNADDFFVFAADANGNPFYKFIENATPGDYTFEFEDLESFDHTVEVSLSPTRFLSYANIRGFEPGQSPSPGHGYYTNYYLNLTSDPPISTYKLGYLDRFEKYLTTVWAQYQDYSLSYVALGPRPAQNFALTKTMDVTVTNKTFSDYAVSGDAFDHYESYWIAAKAVGSEWYFTNWKNVGRNPEFRSLREIPVEIAEKFPNLDFEGLMHGRSVFNKGTSFESVIGITFENDPAPQSYELFSFEIW